MRTITLEELLEAGCHFGHQVTRQNPKSRDYVFEARDGIHIIDLAKTKEGLEEAAKFVKEIAAKGGTMVVLGTKRQASQVIRDEVKRAQDANADGIYYVTNRWIGGIFTNYAEVAKNFRKLKDLIEKLQNKDAQAGYTKKEVSMWDKERQKLESFYSGIKEMTRIPDAIFVVDTHQEDIAVREAMNMHVKTVGIVDTNADPNLIDYPIPANDDAVGSVQLLTSYIVDAWIEGVHQAKKAGEATSTTPVTSEGKKEASSEKAAKKESKTSKAVKKGAEVDSMEGTKDMEQEVKAATEEKTPKKTTKKATKTK